MGDVWLATQIPPFLGLFSLKIFRLKRCKPLRRRYSQPRTRKSYPTFQWREAETQFKTRKQWNVLHGITSTRLTCQRFVSSNSLLILDSWDAVAFAVVPFAANSFACSKLPGFYIGCPSWHNPRTTQGRPAEGCIFGVTRLRNMDSRGRPCNSRGRITVFT